MPVSLDYEAGSGNLLADAIDGAARRNQDTISAMLGLSGRMRRPSSPIEALGIASQANQVAAPEAMPVPAARPVDLAGGVGIVPGRRVQQPVGVRVAGAPLDLTEQYLTAQGTGQPFLPGAAYQQAAQGGQQGGGQPGGAPGQQPPVNRLAQVPGMAMNQGQLADLMAQGPGWAARPLPDNLTPPGLPLGGTYPRLQGGQATGYTTQAPTWENTALAPGLPTYDDVLRQVQASYGTLPGVVTPEMRQQAMQNYSALLQATSGARTQAGQLGVEQGRLGLQQIQALGAPGLPGSMQNEAIRTQLAQQQAADVLSHSARVDTVASSILQQMAAAGQTITPEAAARVRRAVAGTIQSGTGAPGMPGPGQPGLPGGGVGGQGGGQQGGGIPGIPGPPAPGGPPTGNVADQDALETAWAGIVNGPLGAGGGQGGGPRMVHPDHVNDAITQFFTVHPPTGSNVNAMRQFMLDHGITQDQLDRWFTARDARGATSAAAVARRQVRAAMNQIQPGFVSGTSYNAQTPWWQQPGNAALRRLGAID